MAGIAGRSDTVNKLAVKELTQIRSELAEMTASAMKLSLPLDDTDEEELTTNRLCELNAEIEEKAQSFVELNAIRLDAQQEAERARQALARSVNLNIKLPAFYVHGIDIGKRLCRQNAVLST